MKTRIITSAVGIAIGIAILFLSDTIVFNLAVAAITIIMLHELFAANKCNNSKVMMTVCYVFAAFTPLSYFFEILIPYRTAVASVGIFIMFASYIYGHKELKFEHVFFMVSSTALITYSMNCLIELKNMHPAFGVILVLLALCGAWIADSGAYFVGTFLGKTKLCPEISPKKTVEGFIGGLISNGLFFDIIVLVYVSFFMPQSTDIVWNPNYILLFVLGILCAAIGTLGDLTASIIKRQCGIKDYGNIMPGHGGLLDRFDSVLFVVPFMFAFLNIVGIF